MDLKICITISCVFSTCRRMVFRLSNLLIEWFILVSISMLLFSFTFLIFVFAEYMRSILQLRSKSVLGQMNTGTMCSKYSLVNNSSAICLSSFCQDWTWTRMTDKSELSFNCLITFINDWTRQTCFYIK